MTIQTRGAYAELPPMRSYAVRVVNSFPAITVSSLLGCCFTKVNTFVRLKVSVNGDNVPYSRFTRAGPHWTFDGEDIALHVELSPVSTTPRRSGGAQYELATCPCSR